MSMQSLIFSPVFPFFESPWDFGGVIWAAASFHGLLICSYSVRQTNKIFIHKKCEELLHLSKLLLEQYPDLVGWQETLQPPVVCLALLFLSPPLCISCDSSIHFHPSRACDAFSPHCFTGLPLPCRRCPTKSPPIFLGQ